jgi:hypothetical protein
VKNFSAFTVWLAWVFDAGWLWRRDSALADHSLDAVQVSVIPRAREVRFVRLLRAESHPARCSGLLWLRLRSAQRMPTSVHLLCGFAGMTAALERRHRLAVGGLVIDDQPLSFGATFHGVTE